MLDDELLEDELLGGGVLEEELLEDELLGGGVLEDELLEDELLGGGLLDEELLEEELLGGGLLLDDDEEDELLGGGVLEEELLDDELLLEEELGIFLIPPRMVNSAAGGSHIPYVSRTSTAGPEQLQAFSPPRRYRGFVRGRAGTRRFVHVPSKTENQV